MNSSNSHRLPVPVETSHVVHRNPPAQDSQEEPQKLPLAIHTCDHSDGCAARKVFETNELLEGVLEYVSTTDILSLRLVNKQWASLVQASPTLRLHLFANAQWPYPAMDFQLLSVSIRGLEIRRGDPVHLGHWIEVKIDVDAADHILNDSCSPHKTFNTIRCASIGILSPPQERPKLQPNQVQPRYDDLQITQPPITSIQAQTFLVRNTNSASPSTSAGFNRRTHDPPRGAAKLHCDAGITLGFLARTAKNLLIAGHSPLGSSRLPFHTGSHVLFRAIVSYCQTDTAPRERSRAETVTQLPSVSVASK